MPRIREYFGLIIVAYIDPINWEENWNRLKAIQSHFEWFEALLDLREQRRQRQRDNLVRNTIAAGAMLWSWHQYSIRTAPVRNNSMINNSRYLMYLNRVRLARNYFTNILDVPLADLGRLYRVYRRYCVLLASLVRRGSRR